MDKKGWFAVIGIAVLVAMANSNRVQAATFVCPIDGQSFATQAALDEHMAANHPSSRVPIKIKWS
jgi:hypothetical protein